MHASKSMSIIHGRTSLKESKLFKSKSANTSDAGFNDADLKVSNEPIISSSSTIKNDLLAEDEMSYIYAAKCKSAVKVKGTRKSKSKHPTTTKSKIASTTKYTAFKANITDDEFTHDFDFQGSLNMFDKKTVMDEIRRLDETLPEELLVNLNIRQLDGVSKVPHNINVLDLDSDYLSSDVNKSSNVRGFRKDKSARIRRIPSLPKNMCQSTDSTGPQPAQALKRDNPTKTTHFQNLNGISIPTLSIQSINDIHAELNIDYQDIMIENGSRSAAMLTMQALGGDKRINLTSPKPKVTVLIGNNKTGAYGFATARHLTNHGCNVTVCTSYNEQEIQVFFY